MLENVSFCFLYPTKNFCKETGEMFVLQSIYICFQGFLHKRFCEFEQGCLNVVMVLWHTSMTVNDTIVSNLIKEVDAISRKGIVSLFMRKTDLLKTDLHRDKAALRPDLIKGLRNKLGKSKEHLSFVQSMFYLSGKNAQQFPQLWKKNWANIFFCYSGSPFELKEISKKLTIFSLWRHSDKNKLCQPNLRHPPRMDQTLFGETDSMFPSFHTKSGNTSLCGEHLWAKL